MSRAPRTAARRRAGTVLAAAVLALALAGCGANFQAQTYQERAVTDGNNAAVGAIAIRNIAVLPGSDGTVAAGSDALVRMTLTNDGGEDDALVQASSPAAASVDITGPSGTTARLPLPRLGTTGGTAGLVLRGVKESLRSGSTISITLRFERNGEITMSLPVATTAQYNDQRPRSSNFSVPGENLPQPEGGG